MATTSSRRRAPTKISTGRLAKLVGSGDRIGLFALPFLIVGLVLNVRYPSLFELGGPPTTLAVVSVIVLIPGIAAWISSVILIVRHVPRDALITRGPFAVVKHPLYTSVALLVLPWAGFLFDTWLGLVLGLAVYAGSRIFAPAEEEALSRTFGEQWEQYRAGVRVPWL